MLFEIYYSLDDIKPEETETLETAKNVVNILPQIVTVSQPEMVEA